VNLSPEGLLFGRTTTAGTRLALHPRRVPSVRVHFGDIAWYGQVGRRSDFVPSAAGRL